MRILRNMLLIISVLVMVICAVCTGCGKSVDRLIEELEHPDSDIRESAADALGDMGDSKAVEPLIEVLNDEAWQVRQSVVYALGEIGDPRAVEPLIEALNDEAWQVRRYAAYALGKIGDTGAIEALIETSDDEDENVREGIAFALGRLGVPAPADALSQVCEGTGVHEAAAYQGDIHPVVLLDSAGSEHEWSDDLPAEWVPIVVEAAQLVVCVGEEDENVIEICEYHTGPSITRYRYSLAVVLREAETGEIVASTTLYGSAPRPCGQTEDYSLTKLVGSHVSFEQLREWLQEYVEG